MSGYAAGWVEGGECGEGAVRRPLVVSHGWSVSADQDDEFLAPPHHGA